MTRHSVLVWILGLLGFGLLAVLFQLYQNPLLGVYLANLGLC